MVTTSSVDPIVNAMQASSSGMDTQSLRLRLSSENMSNLDTAGYQRKLVTFHEATAGVGVEAGRIRLDRTEGERIYDPAHPLADENGTVEMSNVDLMLELADAREASRSFEANLQVFSQARDLYQNLIGILQR